MEIIKSAAFDQWEKSIKDKQLKGAVVARIFRLSQGLSGDAKSLKEGLHELRIHYGAGYRIYYKIVNGQLLLLLNGGDKRSQNQDIIKALNIFDSWRKRHG